MPSLYLTSLLSSAGAARAVAASDETANAVESLMLAGHTYENSEAFKLACEFLESKQMDDGGWGETYKVSAVGVVVSRSKEELTR